MPDKNLPENIRDRILTQNDLYNLFSFKRTKMSQLLHSGQLPLVKIGKDYVTTFNILEEWIREHQGEEIYL